MLTSHHVSSSTETQHTTAQIKANKHHTLDTTTTTEKSRVLKQDALPMLRFIYAFLLFGIFQQQWSIFGKMIFCIPPLTCVNDNVTTLHALSNSLTFTRLVASLLPMLCYPRLAYIIVSATGVPVHYKCPSIFHINAHGNLISNKILKTGNSQQSVKHWCNYSPKRATNCFL